MAINYKAKGILKTLGIVWKTEVVKTTTTTTTKPKTNTKVKEWQTAAIADGYTQKKGYFKKYGADGDWGSECEYAAKNIVCKKATIKGIYTNKNLVKFIQNMVKSSKELSGSSEAYIIIDKFA